MPATTANLILNLDHSPNTTHAYRDTDPCDPRRDGKKQTFRPTGPCVFGAGAQQELPQAVLTAGVGGRGQWAVRRRGGRRGEV